MPPFSYKVLLSGADFQALTSSRRQYLDFDIWNVDQSVEAGAPPGLLEVVRGRFDPAATKLALAACTECEAPEEKAHVGVKYYSWGEDQVVAVDNIYAPPAFDRLGRGGRIAVLEEYVFRTVETADMEALIDAYRGNRDSLADVKDYRLLAEGLSELAAFSAFLTDKSQSLDETLTDLLGESYTQVQLDALMASLGQEPLLRPYQVFATGTGKDKDGRYMALVLVHDDAETTSQNVGQLKSRIQMAKSLVTGEPWTQLVDNMEVRSDGRVLLAKLRGERIARAWLRWVFSRDSLILHE